MIPIVQRLPDGLLRLLETRHHWLRGICLVLLLLHWWPRLHPDLHRCSLLNYDLRLTRTAWHAGIAGDTIVLLLLLLLDLLGLLHPGHGYLLDHIGLVILLLRHHNRLLKLLARLRNRPDLLEGLPWSSLSTLSSSHVYFEIGLIY